MPALAQPRTPITAYTDFADLCYAYTTGTTLAGPTWGGFAPTCPPDAAPWLFSVTQETPAGDHDGSANWIGPGIAYMADYTYPLDLGRWLTMTERGGIVSLAENIRSGTNSATGWPLAYGHTFVGGNDISIPPNATLDRDVAVDMDVQLARLPPRSVGPHFVGARIVLGGLIEWPESHGRTNTDHYLEIDLAQTPGYGRSLGSFANRPLCFDAPYDGCFYDPNGRNPEGRYVSYDGVLGRPSVPIGGSWTHIAVDYGKVAKALHWVSPPATWANAYLAGLYVAVEGIGQQRTILKIRNWNPTMGR